MNAMSSPFVRWGAGALAFVAILAALRLQPWERSAGTASEESSARGRETLAVGFLPVTCHLTCPVTDYASKTSVTTRFESQRFTDFPTVVETVKSGRLDATFMIAPLAMKLREQGGEGQNCVPWTPGRFHRHGAEGLAGKVVEGSRGTRVCHPQQVQ